MHLAQQLTLIFLFPLIPRELVPLPAAELQDDFPPLFVWLPLIPFLFFLLQQPLQFDLGIGQVIKGWDEGIEGMKVGGKRTLKIPSEMGYGARGAGSVIPPHSNLIFDIELVDVVS